MKLLLRIAANRRCGLCFEHAVRAALLDREISKLKQQRGKK